MKKHLIILSAFMLCLCGCNGLHEAQDVVAEADSLRAEGVMYADSERIAAAVAAFKPLRLVYPTDYAKANYYYGRLLRNRENYVAAMQCFIDATESNTDNIILGRVYSNIGTLCHLAGEYSLSYDMIEKSAEYFINAEDSIAYYYALNKMAFELAEQHNKDGALNILNKIEQLCSDSAVIASTLGTKAQIYLRTQQYDSTLYYSSILIKQGNTEPHIIMLIAQAYSYLQNNDSALYYANIIMNFEGRINDKFNALYILLHNDSTISTTKALDISSEREDIRHDMYEPRKEQLIQAVQILRQNIDKKPNFGFPLVIAVTIMLSLFIVIRVKRWKNKQMHETEKEHQQYLELHRENEKQQEVAERLIIEQQTISHTTNLLIKQQDTYRQQILNEIEMNVNLLAESTDIKQEIHWTDYNRMCDKINKRFFSLVTKLKKYNLSEQEIRLCVLIFLKFDYEEMAKMLNYSFSGIGKFKYRTAKKIGTTNLHMRDFIIQIAVEGH